MTIDIEKHNKSFSELTNKISKQSTLSVSCSNSLKHENTQHSAQNI